MWISPVLYFRNRHSLKDYADFLGAIHSVLQRNFDSWVEHVRVVDGEVEDDHSDKLLVEEEDAEVAEEVPEEVAEEDVEEHVHFRTKMGYQIANWIL